MTFSPAAPAPPTASSEAERACIMCGYSLGGLPESGVCPECGTLVERSLRGSLLRNSSPEYLAKIHQGVFLVLTAVILQILAGVCLFIFGIVVSALQSGGGGSGLRTLEILGALAAVVLAAMQVYGLWLFTEPDPAFTGRDDGASARQLVRIATVIVAGVSIGGFLIQIVGIRPGPLAVVLSLVIGVASVVASVVSFFAQMQYLRWLAPRLPNQRVFKRAGMLRWLGPVLYTVGLLLVIGPLIALVLYWNMLDWVRKDLKRIRGEADGDGASRTS